MSIPRNLSKLAEGTDSSGILGIAYGGTGGSSQADAKAALGLHAVATSGSYSDLLNKPTTANIIENTNLYFTDARARASVSASGSLSYNSATGVFSYTTPSTSGISEGTNLYYTDARARGALSASTGISYNSTTGAISTTITQYTDTLARGAVSASGDLSYNSTTGVFSYTTPSTSGIVEGTNLYFTDARARASISVTGAGSYNSTTGVINIVGGVTSFNTRTGAITLSSADVTGALGFTPYNATNPSGYLTGITSSQVTTALGFTPYNSTNPNGYITGITSSNVTTALGFTPYNATNPSGYISGITSGMVTTALGYTPYNSSNPSGYITSAALGSYLPLSGGTLTGDLRLSTIRDTSGIWIMGKYGSEISLGSAGAVNDIRFNSSSNAAFEYRGSAILHAGNYTSYSPSLSGSGASGTWGINISGNATTASTASYANAALRIVYNDGPRDLSNRLPNSFLRTVNFDFVSAGSGNGSGNYAGVMTYSPWEGTTASTGDSSYQLAFANQSGVNASGQPKLSIRNGIDTTWNAWYVLLHSGNYSSYALPLSGGALSGAIRAPQITAGGSTNTDANLGVQGTSHLTGTIYYGGTVGNVNSWSSISTSSSGTHTFSGSRFVFDRYGYGSQALIDLQQGSITLSQPTTITGELTLNASNTRFNSSPALLSNGQFSFLTYASAAQGARFAGIQVSSSYSGSVPTNGILFFADTALVRNTANELDLDGRRLLHASNYSSYALPLSGGTLSGALSATSGLRSYYSDHIPGDGYGIRFWESNSYKISMGVSSLYQYGTVTDYSIKMQMDNGSPGRGFTWGRESHAPVAALNATTGSFQTVGAVKSGNNMARPNASWGSSGATGMAIFKLPGGSNNYGMIHMVFDIYEYNGNSVSTVIVGGHNWAGSWYNIGANVIGQCGKQVRLGFIDGQYCVVFGDGSSYWEYGQVVLRKIQNGEYYNNVMDLGAAFSVVFTASASFSNISGDLRALRTPASFNAGGAITQAGNQVLHAGNYTSYSPSLTGSGASGTWGINVTGTAGSISGFNNPATAATANTIVYRDANAHITGNYILGSYFNASAGNSENPTIGQVWTQSTGDNYLRKSTPAHFISQLGLLTTGNYSSYALPLSGGTISGDITVSNGRKGLVGVYDPTQTQAVFAMGPSYKLTDGGGSSNYGNFYGLGWSYDPNYGGSGNNPQSKSGLGHQLLLMMAGTTRTALGTGIWTDGNITATANITAYSDERLKTNWQPMPENYVTRLAQIKVGIYERIDGDKITQVGVSAQSFQNLLPQAIMTSGDEMQTLSVSYGNAALASAVELAKEVVDLKTRVAQLEALIEKLIKE